MGNQCSAFLRTLLAPASAPPVGGGPARHKVALSAHQKGPRVRVEDRRTASGEGTVLAVSSCEQDLCYFECRVVRLPAPTEDVPDGVPRAADFSIGVARQSQEPAKDFDCAALGTSGAPGWSLGGAQLRALELRVGDVIGVYVDQSSVPRVDFSLNGKRLGQDYTLPRSKADDIRGQIFPAVSVSPGVALECIFAAEDLKFLSPTESFQPIIPSREML